MTFGYGSFEKNFALDLKSNEEKLGSKEMLHIIS